ncbi:putative helicase MOV-10 isoform X2 [Chiloscyllium plagiosum]|uniref:putative helicase MOV-10 isoform X2 n=1 Tax=Chiloscyllium plagiosum TaxID=36176 RepID=UPI001CB84E4C|nr:putative helicase MOV-10 isoform X2 [Chiloscyllium plagiosum]
MPKKFRIKDMREVGLKFIEFLKDAEQEEVTDREILKSIYNSQFRGRNGVLSVNFSSVLYALSRTGKARVTGGKIYFNSQLKKVEYADQYRNRWPDPADNLGMPSPAAPIQEPGKKDRAKAIIYQMRQNKKQIVQNKGGVRVFSDFDTGEGKIEVSLHPNNQKSVPIHIKNEGIEIVTFVRCEMLCKFPVFTLGDEANATSSRRITLATGITHQIEVICSMPDSGYFPVTLTFQFEDASSRPFSIIRFFSARVTSSIIEELKPTGPYKPYQGSNRRPTEAIIEDGWMPNVYSNYRLEKARTLHQFRYPEALFTALKHGLKQGKDLPDVKMEVERINSLPAKLLGFSSYSERFSLLLHMEEIQMEADITRYNMTGVPMHQDPHKRQLLILQVPGVAENRPSVLRGDHLFASKCDDVKQPITRYKGYVHAVELEQVKLGFSQKLLNAFINNMKFDVTFTFNRLPLQLQHRAAKLANEDTSLKDVLFPTYSDGQCMHPLDKSLAFYDRSLENNPEQADAVRYIVSGISRPAPYLVFGPPGTGKTVTIVEAIKQVLCCIPTAHILACAPTNSATDLLCQRIQKHVNKKDIYRLNAVSRTWSAIPCDVKECSNWNESNQAFEFPTKEELQQYRVIATTLITAGRLASAKFPYGYFSHVFIDEAGNAVEPECVIAVAGLLDVMDLEKNKDGGQLVLAGDPKQLGPVLRSPIAIKHGLDLSFLERLMSGNTLYQKHPSTGCYDKHFVTKLLRNYRSHPSILRIPNELFYDNELKAHADKLISHSYCQWQELPKKDFPIIFHGVLGKDEREEKSPSFFNSEEIQQVLIYLKKLLTNQGKKGFAKISPKEIGVITPYRKQVEKIREAIYRLDVELKAMNDIRELKVGSVEEFQGQERKVIIISTVRSCSNYLQMDEDFNLGFLKNPKRCNVALTRAKALLIVVGNPKILSKDPNWNSFLSYCVNNQSYTGYNYANDEIESDLVESLGKLSLDPDPADPDAVSIIQQQLEPEWRSEV